MAVTATVNFINRKKSQTRAGMNFVLAYTQREDKTLFGGRKLVSGLNCTPQSVYEEFINTKLFHSKDSQRMYYHFVQSFHKDEHISPQTAHEIALKLAAHYKDFEVLVSTHTDRDHIHSHFIINSVSFETGRKLHQSAQAIQELRQESDALCMEYGLSICQPKQRRTKPMTAGEYHTAAKGESWKMRLINNIDECMRYAASKEVFIKMMETEGYAVKWTDSRKSITYTTPDGQRCRDDRLHEQKYLKERMELELRIRQEIINGGTQAAEQTSATAPTDAPVLSFDSAGCGRTVRDAYRLTGTDERSVQAEPPPSVNGEQPSDTGRAVTNQPEPVTDTADNLTGWETERAFFFSATVSLAEDGIVSPVDDYSTGFGGLAGDLVQLGRALERLDSPVSIRDSTAQKMVHERKKSVGQKQDDHSGYDFEMKM